MIHSELQQFVSQRVPGSWNENSRPGGKGQFVQLPSHIRRCLLLTPHNFHISHIQWLHQILCCVVFL